MSQGNHFIWAIIAGVVIMINGVIQTMGNNTVLAVACILIGAGAIAFGIIKPGGKRSGPPEAPENDKDHD